VEIVDGGIVAHRHPKHPANNLRNAGFVETGHDPDRGKRAIGQIAKRGVRPQPRLNDQRLATRSLDELLKEVFAGKTLTGGIGEHARTDPVPALGAAAASALDRLNE
jgi:hypothetical protein